MQEYRGFLKKNTSNPKPKQRILIDLATFITTWRSINPHSSIIGMLDANADSTEPQILVIIRARTSMVKRDWTIF